MRIDLNAVTLRELWWRYEGALEHDWIYQLIKSFAGTDGEAVGLGSKQVSVDELMDIFSGS